MAIDQGSSRLDDDFTPQDSTTPWAYVTTSTTRKKLNLATDFTEKMDPMNIGFQASLPIEPPLITLNTPIVDSNGNIAHLSDLFTIIPDPGGTKFGTLALNSFFPMARKKEDGTLTSAQFDAAYDSTLNLFGAGTSFIRDDTKAKE
jgi:hypothetical protein